MSEPVNIALVRPIKAHGKDLAGLTLRPLTARELRLHGFPFLLRQSASGSVTEEINTPVISAIVGDLAGVPTSSVDQLQPADYMEAVNAIRLFLVDTTAPGSSPSPGV